MSGERTLLAEHLVALVAGEHAFLRRAVAPAGQLALFRPRLARIVVGRRTVLGDAVVSTAIPGLTLEKTREKYRKQLEQSVMDGYD